MNLSQYIFDEDNLAGTGGDQLIWQKVVAIPMPLFGCFDRCPVIY